MKRYNILIDGVSGTYECYEADTLVIIDYNTGAGKTYFVGTYDKKRNNFSYSTTIRNMPKIPYYAQEIKDYVEINGSGVTMMNCFNELVDAIDKAVLHSSTYVIDTLVDDMMERLRLLSTDADYDKIKYKDTEILGSNKVYSYEV